MKRTHPAVIQMANLVHLEYDIPLGIAQAFTELVMLHFRLCLDEPEPDARENVIRKALIMSICNSVVRAYMHERVPHMPPESIDAMIIWMWEQAGKTWETVSKDHPGVGVIRKKPRGPR